MATTTNFGWETPDDTDLVKDGALAMRTLGNAIDTSLVDLKGGITGQNLRKNSNTDMDFVWAGDATNTVIDAAGDLLVGTAADTLGRLAIGTAGQVLKVNSGATALEWGTAGGGGKVLQVVTATTTTAVTVASTTYTDGGLSASITPSSATSKVLVLAQQNLYVTRDPADRAFAKAQLVRGASSLFASTYFFGTRSSSATREAVGTFAITWLDSPSTTSATTYKVQIACVDTANFGEVKGQYGSSASSIVLLEIGA